MGEEVRLCSQTLQAAGSSGGANVGGGQGMPAQLCSVTCEREDVMHASRVVIQEGRWMPCMTGESGMLVSLARHLWVTSRRH